MYNKKIFLNAFLILILITSILVYRNKIISQRKQREEEYMKKRDRAVEKFIIATKKASKNDTTALLELYELAVHDSTYTEEADKFAREALNAFLLRKTEFWISTFSKVELDKLKIYFNEKGFEISTFSGDTVPEEKYKQEIVGNLKKIKGDEKETELIDYILKLIEENE